MEIVAGDAEERQAGRPSSAVALRDQLTAGAEPQPRNVGVRQEPVDSAARVVADLEHRVDSVVVKVEVPPRLESGPLRQRLRRDIDRVPTVVVEDDELRCAAGEEPFARGGDVRLEPRLAGLPVLRQAAPDLAHTAELRRAFHVDAHRDEHRPTLQDSSSRETRVHQRAGGGNRTRISRVETWRSTTELRPRWA